MQRYLPELLEHIELGHLSPEEIVTHRMSLEQVAQGYEIFDKRQDNCRKVILIPGAPVEPLPESIEPDVGFADRGVPSL